MLCGLGLPIPEDISLISAGYMAHLGVVNVHTAFVVCLAAVLGGDALAFFLGRLFGRRVLGWGPAQRLFTARKQLRVRAYFRKYGSKVIFIGRFLPGLRFSIFFSAGTLHVRPAVFLIYDTLAALLSVPFLVYLAWGFGEHIDHVIALGPPVRIRHPGAGARRGGVRGVQDRSPPPPAQERAGHRRSAGTRGRPGHERASRAERATWQQCPQRCR